MSDISSSICPFLSSVSPLAADIISSWSCVSVYPAIPLSFSIWACRADWIIISRRVFVKTRVRALIVLQNAIIVFFTMHQDRKSKQFQHQYCAACENLLYVCKLSLIWQFHVNELQIRIWIKNLRWSVLLRCIGSAECLLFGPKHQLQHANQPSDKTKCKRIYQAAVNDTMEHLNLHNRRYSWKLHLCYKKHATNWSYTG